MSWFKPRTSQDIPYVNKDVIEREVKGNLDYLKTTADTTTTNIATNTAAIAVNAAKFDDCVMRDGSAVAYAAPTGTRVKDTVYQNTSGKTRLVLVTVQSAQAQGAQVYVEAADTTPDTLVASWVGDSANSVGNISFFVTSLSYYKVATFAGTLTIVSWIEWDIL